MTTPYLIGIDAGHTVIKAAVFDAQGAEIGRGARPTATFSRHPRWQERDMDVVWASAAGAIADALVDAGIDGSQVASVGIGAHGDGLYLVDADLRPVRAAILATDTRAVSYCAQWATGAVADRLMAITGQVPAPYTPPATLSWLRDHEPDNYARAAHMLFCKDWLRLQLTGEIATDPTEAAAGLCDVRARAWSPEAIALCGLEDAARLLPPILPSGAVAGTVTESAAAATGLAAGTPVITGSHDVHAAALGVGALTPGSVSAIMGTFNINQLVGTEALPSWQWQARGSLADGRFLLMSTSPAGATAVDWVRQVTAQPFDEVGPAVAAALADRDGATVREDDPLFLPFVYGTMLTPAIRGAFTGLGSWHGPSDLLRAGLEGVVFTHRYHLEALIPAGPIDTRPVRLAGGGTRSEAWTQLFADATGLSVQVTDAVESGARGAAMLAGVGAGSSPTSIPRPSPASPWSVPSTPVRNESLCWISAISSGPASPPPCRRRRHEQPGEQMTLSDPRPLLAAARAGGHAVGAFNVIQIEHAEAIVAGAEQAGLPVVLQVSENTAAFHRGLAGIGAASLAIAAAATVPVVVHLDHAESEDLIDQAVALGFTSVMFDGAKLAYAENQARTAEVVGPLPCRRSRGRGGTG